MNINDALILKDKSLYLIGKKYKGSIIDEIIIKPKDENESDSFMKSYIRTLNAEKSLEPFINNDLQVCILCEKNNIKKSNIILMTDIESLISNNLY
jgi:hypothetical protein